ncbi:transposase [Novosphingobium sp. G106]|uniref:transposase n=1 Tax=Novosphingobium sp. G106 TaxID=2849500 RepID=UPI001C2DC538|nr:transposase [Novosphingobium sp. G106]
MDCLPSSVLPAGPCALPTVPAVVSRTVASPPHAAGWLQFFGDLALLHHAACSAETIRAPRKKRWITCAKPPFSSPEHVLAYLGRYTRRVAIANSRLVRADDTSVTFRWRDDRQGNASAT